MLKWVSGLNQQFAKLSSGMFPSEGSNPSFNAIISGNSSVGRTRGLGPWGRGFEAFLSDQTKRDKGVYSTMTKEQKILAYETRLALLESRTEKENKNIANKIRRKIRALKNS